MGLNKICKKLYSYKTKCVSISGKVKHELWVTSSNPQVSSSNPQVTSSNSWVKCSNPLVTSSNPQVTSPSPQVTSYNPRVRRLKVRVGRLKARVTKLKARVEAMKTYDFKEKIPSSKYWISRATKSFIFIENVELKPHTKVLKIFFHNMVLKNLNETYYITIIF